MHLFLQKFVKKRDEWTWYDSLGLSSDGDLVGWKGNQSDVDIGHLTQTLSVIRTMEDCPQVKAKFEENGTIVKRKLSLQLSRAVYPNGRCCRVVVPQLAKSNIVHRLYFRVYPNLYNNKNVEGFKMILSDPRSSSVFRQHEFNIDGDRMTSRVRDLGYQEYKVKIKEEIYLEYNPNFLCNNYEVAGEYDACLESEFISRSLELLNCTPPWITDNETLWCHHSLKLDQHLSDRANFLFEHVIYGKAEDGMCKSSCKKTR